MVGLSIVWTSLLSLGENLVADQALVFAARAEVFLCRPLDGREGGHFYLLICAFVRHTLGLFLL